MLLGDAARASGRHHPQCVSPTGLAPIVRIRASNGWRCRQPSRAARAERPLLCL